MTRTKVAQLLATGSLLGAAAPVFGQQTFGQQLEHVVINPGGGPPTFALLWFASMLVVVAVIFMALRFANERDRNRQELIARFIDKGQEIPSFLIPQPSPRRELRRGVLLTGLGLGLGVVLYIVSGDWRVAAWCLIPLCLAAASLLNAAMFSKPDSPQ